MKVRKYASFIAIGFITACAPPKPMSEPPLKAVMPEGQPQVKTLASPADNSAPLNAPTPLSSKATMATVKTASSVFAWELRGAIAARNNKKAWTASINWLQRGPNNYQIRLFGPLGGGSVIVEKQGNVVTYRDGPRKGTSSNADELLFKETGVRLPVHDLYYWVRGVPAPGGVQSTAYDANHHLTSLKQDGYQIDYGPYTSQGKTDLPSKINLQGHGVNIKLVIKKWSV